VSLRQLCLSIVLVADGSAARRRTRRHGPLMAMKLSKFAENIAKTSGIGQLMDDLGHTLSGGSEIIMLGGGNPAHIPEVEDCFRRSVEALLKTEGHFGHAIGDYSTSQGDPVFIDAVCGLLNDEFGWGIKAENVVLTNGSQTAFFILFNFFAGEFSDGCFRRILLPLAPEYIGYCDVGLSGGMFVARKPEITHIDERIFKYNIDFDAIEITDDIGAVCVSRPTNPTGNVLTGAELARLSELARQKGIPLIIDNAYGAPFPNIIFTDARPIWNENTIVCMSLSKLGLPGVRTGIIVASEEIVRMVSQVNAVMSLAPGSIGAAIVTDLVRSKRIITLCREHITPFYFGKAQQAVEQLTSELGDVDFHIHKPEGAFFLWLWFRDLPISCEELYERLKKRGVLVIPGHHFFPGLDEPWQHKDECIRLNYAADEALVRRGITIVADEVKRAYAKR